MCAEAETRTVRTAARDQTTLPAHPKKRRWHSKIALRARSSMPLRSPIAPLSNRPNAIFLSSMEATHLLLPQRSWSAATDTLYVDECEGADVISFPSKTIVGRTAVYAACEKGILQRARRAGLACHPMVALTMWTVAPNCSRPAWNRASSPEYSRSRLRRRNQD